MGSFLASLVRILTSMLGVSKRRAVAKISKTADTTARPRLSDLWTSICGPDGSRTRDLVPAEHALYQLSYRPAIRDSINAPAPLRPSGVRSCAGLFPLDD